MHAQHAFKPPRPATKGAPSHVQIGTYIFFKPNSQIAENRCDLNKYPSLLYKSRDYAISFRTEKTSSNMHRNKTYTKRQVCEHQPL